jgi:hypothetical protein
MWKAALIGKVRNEDQLRVKIQFFDDSDTTKSFVQEFVTSADVGTLEWLKAQVKNKISSLTKLDATIATLPEGEVTIAADALPTPEEAARQLYQNKLYLYQHMQRGIQYGIFTGSETQVVSTKKWLVDNFQNEFIDLL